MAHRSIAAHAARCLLVLTLAASPALPLSFGVGGAAAKASGKVVDKAAQTQNCANGQGSLKTGVTGPITFTVSPLNINNAVWYAPLGNLNPPGHTFPSDHGGFYYVDPGNPDPNKYNVSYQIFAPADGFISKVLPATENGTVQYKIYITHTDTFQSWLDHVITIEPSLMAQINAMPSNCLWVQVHAGQLIGTVGGVVGENGLDLGVTNLQVTQPFITPSHYGYGSHSDDALKYFTGALQASLYSIVQRQGADYLGITEKDGIFCYDTPNAVLGNWVAQGADPNWGNPDMWQQQLSFAYDPRYASQINITFGGMYGNQPFLTGQGLGPWVVAPGSLPPASVTAATGAYGYVLYGWDPNFGTLDLNSGPGGSTAPLGLLMVQLIDNHTLKVEYFSYTALGVTSLPFDANAKIYTR